MHHRAAPGQAAEDHLGGVTTETELAQKIFDEVGGCDGLAKSSRFVAVPGNGTTRWLLPTEGKVPSKVLRSWAPYRIESRIGWATVRAANWIGQVEKLPSVGVVEIERTRESDWRSLGWRWTEAHVPVIYVGTPGPKRKAVVHLVERETRVCRAVVKVPLTEGARTALLREADVLQQLETERCEAAPRVLYVDRARGLVTQTFVDGLPDERRLTPEHWQVLRSLLIAGEQTSLKAHAERWEREVDGISVPDGIKLAMAELQDDTAIPACWEHGDFTPWNIRRMADGRLVLVDWEEARRAELPLQDAFHFLHMQDFLFGKQPKWHGADLGKEATAMGQSERLVEKLEMAYLVDAYVTCVRRKNEERGKFIAYTLAKIRRRAA